MGVNIGSTSISDLKLGSTQVEKVYLGTTEVWSHASPTPSVRALKFTCAEAQGLSRHPDSAQTWLSFEYSNDGETWATWDVTTTLNFGNGVDLYLRGMNSSFAPNDHRWQFQFTTSAPVYCSGNLMHLLDYTQDLTTLPEGGAQFMFANCPLVTAPDLPATILPDHAYHSMFYDCTSLLEAPALPATTVGASAYSNMFYYCTSLTKANRISALSLPNNACEYMFNGCTSLVTAPALPALSVGSNACSHMFQGCTNLETIPALPATTLGTSCYQYMFASCSKIKMATTQSDDYPNEFIFGTNPAGYCNRMFRNTGGTYVGNPDQTTYYTANTIIS